MPHNQHLDKYYRESCHYTNHIHEFQIGKQDNNKGQHYEPELAEEARRILSTLQ